MSKQQIKKFRKNDWSYDEEEYNPSSKQRVNKSKERRVERALRTKDISSLTVYEDEGLDPIDVEDNIWLDENLDETLNWNKH